MLPESWERRLVDMNVRRLKDADIEWADMVFAGSMIVQKASLELVIKRSKALGKRVVLGGPYVSTTEHLPDVDHVFVARLFFRGIYFPQMTRRAWLRLLYENRRTITSLTREGFAKWRESRRRSGEVSAAVTASAAGSGD